MRLYGAVDQAGEACAVVGFSGGHGGAGDEFDAIRGIISGVVLSTLVFWLPVVTALMW